MPGVCTAKFSQYDGPQLQQKSNSNGGWKRGLEPKCKVNNYCVIALSENYSITFFDGAEDRQWKKSCKVVAFCNAVVSRSQRMNVVAPCNVVVSCNVLVL